MKRAEQLQKLSREHHDSLIMARTLIRVVETGSETDLQEAIATVTKFFDDEIEEHFQHEERTIFAPIFKDYKEHMELSKTLLKEHGFMRLMIPKLALEGTRENLAEFALVLKNHTHTEERDLFPIIEKRFTDEQLDAILNFVPIN